MSRDVAPGCPDNAKESVIVDFRDPDFTPQPLNTTTVQYLTAFPAFASGFLLTGGEAAWEQAVVVYIDGHRLPEQLGNYDRPTLLPLPTRPFVQQIMLAGWHKRSGPDGGQPWHASNGLTVAGGKIAAWDDSGGDRDFNDISVEQTVLGTSVHPLTSGPFAPVGAVGGARTQVAADEATTADILTALVTLKELATSSPTGGGVAGDPVDAQIRGVIRNYFAVSDPGNNIPVLPRGLAVQLAWRAHQLHSGSLREALLQLAREMVEQPSQSSSPD